MDHISQEDKNKILKSILSLKDKEDQKALLKLFKDTFKGEYDYIG